MMDKTQAAQIVGDALGEYVAAGWIEFTPAMSPFVHPEDHIYRVATSKPAKWGKTGAYAYLRLDNGEIEAGRWDEIAPRQLSAMMGLLDDALFPLSIEIEGLKKQYPLTVAHVIEPWLTEDGGERAEAVQALLSRKVGRPRGKARPKASEILATTDPVSRTVFNANSKERFTPEDYLRGRSRSVKATSKGWVSIYIKASEELAKSGDPNDFMMGGTTWFWHDGLYTLASQGERYIAGSDILRLYRYTNPYSADCVQTLIDGLRDASKLTQNVGWVDASKEKRKGMPVGFDPVAKTRRWVEGNVVIGHNGNSFDWVIELDPDGDPLDHLLIAQYAGPRQMVAPIDSSLFEFSKGLCPNSTARQAYAYLIKQASTKGLGNKVLLSTLFDSIELAPPNVASKKGTGKATPRKDGSTELRSFAEIERAEREADRKRKKRIVEMLGKMLTQKQGEGRLTFSTDETSITVNLSAKKKGEGVSKDAPTNAKNS